MLNTFAANAMPPNIPPIGSLTIPTDDHWYQSGTYLTVTSPRNTLTSVQATVVSTLGGTLKFDGTHASRFTCSLNGTDYATTQTLPAGTSTVYLGVTPEAGDTALSARVGVPV